MPRITSSYCSTACMGSGMVTIMGGDSSLGSVSGIGIVLLDKLMGEVGEGFGGVGESGKGVVSASPSIFCGGFYRYLHSWA